MTSKRNPNENNKIKQRNSSTFFSSSSILQFTLSLKRNKKIFFRHKFQIIFCFQVRKVPINVGAE